MPKAQKRKRLATAAAPNRRDKSSDDTATITETLSTTPPLNGFISKREKREQKHQQWLAKLSHNYREMHNQKKKQQKPKFGDLSEFSAFLNTLSAPLAQPTKSVDDSANIKRRNEQLPDKTTITSTMAAVPVDAANKTPVVVHVRSKKGRKRALISELLQFQAVLRHPAFQSQPLSTIQQHIRNTASQIN